MLRHLNLVAYIFLTVLGMLALVHWADPPVQPGQGCRVAYVIDGDSLGLDCPDGQQAARIMDIDTPEMRGQCPAEIRLAQAAKEALKAMIYAAQEVRVEISGQDKYRRVLVHLVLDGQNASRMMLAAGHGRPYDGGRRAGWCD
ncbi:thermonuclease family protein [Xinfangfangia sp. CPCC 101601]|uniref:Thermonuclease family protein n=1 Tax=Pseudogemmobacter lacusdianii TaxID=3069608 RepID=A0ABU0VY47_9RHOB|nr:thermonuclease family protein [Xinfangfangia sp. CPCC 101601]MDQ2066680.1 thermonuclease family protein [Xinfangfangia sp. CPCC 101601]